MTRRASSSRILKNVVVIFLIFFAVFVFLSTGLSLIYQPLFAFLISAPTYTMIALFALAMTLIVRQSSVAQVPSNTIGLLTAPNGMLKALAPPGPVWVWFGRERLSGFLSLEPVSTHVPLLGLRSGDEIALAPLVTIITWRIHATMTTLAASEFGQEVLEVAQESPLKRERRVRDKVAEVMGRWVAEESLAELEEDLPNISSNSFGEGVLKEVNQYLTSIGLKVERLECIGSISMPGKTSEAVKTIGEVRKKLERLLRASPTGTGMQDVQRGADDLLRRARRAVKEMSAASRAMYDYTQTMLEAVQQGQQHIQSPSVMRATGVAQKTQSQRLTELAAEINALLEAANTLKEAIEGIERSPSELTADESATLFKVLEAIEQKKVPLGSLFA